MILGIAVALDQRPANRSGGRTRRAGSASGWRAGSCDNIVADLSMHLHETYPGGRTRRSLLGVHGDVAKLISSPPPRTPGSVPHRHSRPKSRREITTFQTIRPIGLVHQRCRTKPISTPRCGARPGRTPRSAPNACAYQSDCGFAVLDYRPVRSAWVGSGHGQGLAHRTRPRQSSRAVYRADGVKSHSLSPT